MDSTTSAQERIRASCAGEGETLPLGGGRVGRDWPRRVEPARNLLQRPLDLSQQVRDASEGLGHRHSFAAQPLGLVLERAQSAAKLVGLSPKLLALSLPRLESLAHAIPILDQCRDHAAEHVLALRRCDVPCGAPVDDDPDPRIVSMTIAQMLVESRLVPCDDDQIAHRARSRRLAGADAGETCGDLLEQRAEEKGHWVTPLYPQDLGSAGLYHPRCWRFKVEVLPGGGVREHAGMREARGYDGGTDPSDGLVPRRRGACDDSDCC